MIADLTAVVDAVWAYSSRTLAAAPSVPPSDGSYVDDIGYAVWTYTDRSVINPPVTVIPRGFALVGGGGFDASLPAVLINGNGFSDSDQWMKVDAGEMYFPPSPDSPPLVVYTSTARRSKDATWTQGEHYWPVLIWDGSQAIYSYPDRYSLRAKPNTMLSHCLAEVRALAQNWTTFNIFSTQDHASATYIRNYTCITGTHDISCIAAWNSRSAGQRSCTAITPLHGVTAEHYKLLVGDQVRFVAMDNTVVQRTIVAGAAIIPGYDGWLVQFDSPLPSSIQPAWLPPEDLFDYQDSQYRDYGYYKPEQGFGPGGEPIYEDPAAYLAGAVANYYPAFFRKQNNELIYVEARTTTSELAGGTEYPYAGANLRYTEDWTQTVEFRPYTKGVQSGDSGGPGFSIINGQLMLRWTAYGPAGGPGFDNLGPLLQSQTDNSCRFCDLSNFEKVSL